MPTYQFKDQQTGEYKEFFMKISDLDDFKKNNPQLIQVHVTPFEIGDTVRMGMRKPDQNFRELLKHIHNKVGGNHKYTHN